MRWVVLILLFFGAVINFADKSIVGLAAVPIMKEFNLTYAEWGACWKQLLLALPSNRDFWGSLG
ncbi:hypothetical protein Q5O89_17115 [Peribacillus frigoritolerans]|nr:hypothetical protein [Peribacillus frigoritolerans]